MKKLNVLQVNKFYYPHIGGVEHIVQQIAEGLCRETAMTVLACQPKGAGSTEEINGVTVRKSSSVGTYFSMPLSFSFFRDFTRMSPKADIVHIHMPFPLGDAALFLSKYKGKVILWWHSDIVKQKKLLILYRPLMKWLLKRADKIIVATEGHIAHSDYLPPYKEKCVIIPYGTNLSFSQNHEPDGNKTESTKNIRLLYVGRLVYYKGCDILLKAMAKVEGVSLTIIGDGVLKDDLQKLSAELNVSDKVTFKNNLSSSELSQEYAACDIFVLPSVAKSEAFGLVQIEAMAHGKPVINTDLPSGVPYVSLHNITGLTVPPKDDDALAKAIQSLADNTELRAKFGAAAKKRAENEFSETKMLKSILTLYKKITQREFAL